MLQLKRPIVFIDLETTGLDRENDRIVQISMKRLMPDFTIDILDVDSLINPCMPIPEESTKIHGITNAMVAKCPTFRQIAGTCYEFLVGCDLGGFNSNWFDIPLLYHEFARCGIHLDYRAFSMIDVGNLFKIAEPRNLSKAVQFYCEREMVGAHDANIDNIETINVFLAQLKRYPELPDTVEELALFTNYNCKVADLSGKFVYGTDGEDGQILYLNFGKYKGQPAHEHLDFVQWMLFKADFPADTNEICRELLKCYDDDDGLGW